MRIGDAHVPSCDTLTSHHGTPRSERLHDPARRRTLSWLRAGNHDRLLTTPPYVRFVPPLVPDSLPTLS
jgi:hypothetical protein